MTEGKNMTNENVGKIIGIYEIVGVCDERDTDGHLLYRVKCRCCGFETDMRLFDIKRPSVCKHTNKIGNIIYSKTIWSNQKLEMVFHDMLQRCYNPNHKSYRWYGEKGIKVYDEWINDPKLFEKWALDHEYKDGLTIDRINADQDYSPDNCRWITLEENSRRAGKVNWITVNNETLTGKQWANKLGLGENTVNKFIVKYGLEKTTELISKMLKDPPSNKYRKTRQTWLSLYDIAV